MKKKVAAKVPDSTPERTGPELTPEIKKACAAYVEKAKQAKSEAEHAEKASWARAAAALKIKEECDKKQIHYLDVAAAECKVSMAQISMDVGAELVRTELKLNASDLPAASLSAMYELHRAHKAIRREYGVGENESIAFGKKMKDIGNRIASGELSQREVRKAVANDILVARQREKRKMSGRKQKRNSKVSARPVVRSLAAKELTTMVKSLAKTSDESFSAVTIRPAKPTLKSVGACFADPKTRAAIVASCPRAGGFWIYVDMTPVVKEKHTTVDTVSTTASGAAA